jgi:hypothetical protein
LTKKENEMNQIANRKIGAKVSSLMLCVLLMAGAFLLPPPIIAHAAEADSGTCGPGLTWSFDDDGTLTIIGSGAMDDYWGTGSNAPWYKYRNTNSDNLTGPVIENVIIGDGVTHIGGGAFLNCTQFKALALPDSVNSIGESSFAYASGLETAALGKGLVTIEARAFDHCIRLQGIIIPAGVTEIPDGAFQDCSALTNVTLPAGVTSIGSSAFAFAAITGINLPDGLKTISGGAFMYSKLVSIAIPDSVTSLERNALAFCRELKEVKLSNALTEISDGLFVACESLVRIEIPASVTRIGASAFHSMASLKEIVFNTAAPPAFDGIYVFINCPQFTAYVPLPQNEVEPYRAALIAAGAPEDVIVIGYDAEDVGEEEAGGEPGDPAADTNGTGTQGTNASGGVKSPRTGDAEPIALWSLLIALAAFGLAAGSKRPGRSGTRG